MNTVREALPIVGEGLILPYSCTSELVRTFEEHQYTEDEVLERLAKPVPPIDILARGMSNLLFHRMPRFNLQDYAQASRTVADFGIRQYSHLEQAIERGTLADETMKSHDVTHYAMDLVRILKSTGLYKLDG